MPRTPEQNEEIRAERRSQILNAAIPLFARLGYDATSMSQVAKAAGISHGTVFLYFPTKFDLFQAALLEPLDEAEEHYQRILNGPGSPLERLQRMVYEQIQRFAGKISYVRLAHQVLGQRDRFPGLIPEGIFGFTARYTARISPIIEEGQRLGEIAPGDPQILALAYFSYLNGVMLILDDPPDSPAWQQMASAGMRLFAPPGKEREYGNRLPG